MPLETKSNCTRERLSVFDDTPQVSESLRGMADEAANVGERYWLLEAAVSLEGLYRLARSAVHWLERETQAHAGSAGKDYAFEQYEALITDWAKQRAIIPNSTAIAQVDKAFEELTELRAAIQAGDQLGVIDGFGDTEVCLINARALAGVSLPLCMDFAWNEIRDRTGHLGTDGIFYKDA